MTEEIPGYRPAWGEDWVSARPPTSAEAKEFGIKRGHPVTVVHARRFDDSDNVIEYAELVARGDAQVVYRYQYSPVGRAMGATAVREPGHGQRADDTGVAHAMGNYAPLLALAEATKPS